MIASAANAWYDAKHPVQTIDEIKMINGLTVEECRIDRKRLRKAFDKEGERGFAAPCRQRVIHDRRR